MSTAWLAKQRKADLADLAEEAGLRGTSNMKKDDLVTALDTHLKSNASRLAGNKAFTEYYSGAPSPVKKEAGASSAAAATSDAEKPKKRRVTKSPTELGNESPEPNTAKQIAKSATPRVVQRVAASVPLPPSPAAVTNLIERQTKYVSTRASRYLRASGVSNYAESLRAAFSSALGIEAIFLAFEAYGLQRVTLPWRFAFDLPGFSLVNLQPLAVRFPDFFVLLTSTFWAPTLLWLLTSIIIPLSVGWFFNPTLNAAGRRSVHREVDPLVFNVTKALIAWLVYAKGITFYGLTGKATATAVNLAIPGGYVSIVIGGAIGALVSVYEAVLRK